MHVDVVLVGAAAADHEVVAGRRCGSPCRRPRRRAPRPAACRSWRTRPGPGGSGPCGRPRSGRPRHRSRACRGPGTCGRRGRRHPRCAGSQAARPRLRRSGPRPGRCSGPRAGPCPLSCRPRRPANAAGADLRLLPGLNHGAVGEPDQVDRHVERAAAREPVAEDRLAEAAEEHLSLRDAGADRGLAARLLRHRRRLGAVLHHQAGPPARARARSADHGHAGRCAPWRDDGAQTRAWQRSVPVRATSSARPAPAVEDDRSSSGEMAAAELDRASRRHPEVVDAGWSGRPMQRTSVRAARCGAAPAPAPPLGLRRRATSPHRRGR